jgi:putative hydrolase of the HAD superfamily
MEPRNKRNTLKTETYLAEGKMPVQAVLFDLGDTLVDLGEGRGSYEARLVLRAGHVYDVLAAQGVAGLPGRAHFAAVLAEDSEAQYHAALAELRGLDIYTVMARFLARQGLPVNDELVEVAGTAYCVGGGGPTAPLRPGALEVLQGLHAAGYRLGAISNTVQPARFMAESLVRRGLAPYFSAQVYSSEAGVAKPHPAIFRRALDLLGVMPEAAVYVGDRLVADVGGAHAAGLRGVLIEVDHRVEQHAEIVPDARIRELAELPVVLQGL